MGGADEAGPCRLKAGPTERNRTQPRFGGRDWQAPLPYCVFMAALNPTPAEKLTDQQGRPYFLWDADMTLDAFIEALRDPDRSVRGYLIGKLMRQAKPDDVFSFVGLDEIHELWEHVEPHLGRTRAFWTWLLERWA